MSYFDLHVHPSLKASLTDDPERFNAWSDIPFYADGVRGVVLQRFKEIITSQANLTQAEQRCRVIVVALIGLELAFARNVAIRFVLASPHVSPLSRKILRQIRKNELSYFDVLKLDLATLLHSQQGKTFNLVTAAAEIKADALNVLLSVEGAHSFQHEPLNPDGSNAEHIVANFTSFKNDARYRLHHLTLTHLTRQPACVHCYGVNIQVLGVNLTRDPDFQPDPNKKGLSQLGKNLIVAAYDQTTSKRVLIDIKHMSYLSRIEFYALHDSDAWRNIPIIVSHAGVTGTSFAAATFTSIERAARADECDLVYWTRVTTRRGTAFNPWTINLFDEDIEQIVASGGMIGVSMDQRILGFEKNFFGEFMSPREVEALELYNRPPALQISDAGIPEVLTKENQIFYPFATDPDVQALINEECARELAEGEEVDDVYGDMLFDLAAEEDHLDAAASAVSHIDFLSHTILHIVEVGWRKGFDGTSGKPNATDCICLGSDMDGIVDSANFPHHTGDQDVDKKNWITINEYNRLQEELAISLERCKQDPRYVLARDVDVHSIIQKVMMQNGMAFLQKHF